MLVSRLVREVVFHEKLRCLRRRISYGCGVTYCLFVLGVVVIWLGGKLERNTDWGRDYMDSHGYGGGWIDG